MTTPKQEPVASAHPQAAVKEQVAKKAAPPSSGSTPGAGGTAVAHRHGKHRGWLLVLTLLILLVGAGFAWAKYTGTDLRATLAAAWHKLMGTDVPEGFALTNGRL